MEKTLNQKLKNFLANLDESELKELGVTKIHPMSASNAAPAVASTHDSLDIKISEILQLIGVPAHIKGYPYLRAAISIVTEQPAMMDAVTKALYPTVAEKFDTTPTRVERAIRHAIEVAFTRGNPDVFNKIFAHTISSHKGKATNSEFVSMLADHIRLGRI